MESLINKIKNRVRVPRLLPPQSPTECIRVHLLNYLYWTRVFNMFCCHSFTLRGKYWTCTFTLVKLVTLKITCCSHSWNVTKYIYSSTTYKYFFVYLHFLPQYTSTPLHFISSYYSFTFIWWVSYFKEYMLYSVVLHHGNCSQRFNVTKYI